MAKDKGDTLDSGHLHRLELGIAAGDNNDSTRMLTDKFMDGLTALVVSNLRDATGVDNADVSHLTFSHLPHADLLQLTGDGGSLGEIEFAAQGEIDRFFSLKQAFVIHAYFLFSSAKVRIFCLTALNKRKFNISIHI